MQELITNNIKNFNQNKDLSFAAYLDKNYLYGWKMCRNIPVNGLGQKERTKFFAEDFIKNYDENNNIGYILEDSIGIF